MKKITFTLIMKGRLIMSYKFNDFSRIKKTLCHKEPDRVPLIEAVVSYEIQSKFLGEKVTPDNLELQVEFWKKAGYDYIPLTVGLMKPGGITDESSITEVVEGDFSEDGFIKSDIINNIDDLERMIDWDKAQSQEYNEFIEVKKYLPDEMKVIATTGKIFTLAWMLIGFENFCINLYEQPELIKEVIKNISKIQIGALNKIISLDYVEAVWIVDDLAYDTGLMISRDHLQEYIYPEYQKIVDLCEENGLYTFLHSDGDITSVINDLTKIGIDAIHPLDPNAVDIKEVKNKVGDKVTLFGNVNVDLLATGSKKEIEEVVKDLIKNIGPGGGYCLGSGNSVPEWAKYENYKTMIDTCLKFGVYN